MLHQSLYIEKEQQFIKASCNAKKGRQKMTMEQVFGLIGAVAGIIGMITGLVGMIVSIRSTWMSRYDIVKDFLKEDDTERIKDARKHIYANIQQSNDALVNDEKYAIICNHYHYYGLMTKKGYIPKYVFDATNIHAITACYELCQEFIKLRRVNRLGYAEHFEWLYRELKKSVPK